MQSIQDQYDILSLAGSGSHGKVYKAQNKKTGDIVAIKHIENFKNSSYQTIKIIREI